MPHSTSPIGTDIQDVGYGLPKIHLLGTWVNSDGHLAHCVKCYRVVLARRLHADQIVAVGDVQRKRLRVRPLVAMLIMVSIC